METQHKCDADASPTQSRLSATSQKIGSYDQKIGFTFPRQKITQRGVNPIFTKQAMITRNVIEGLLDPVRATETDHQFSEIAHDLKNCMSILLYWVETLEVANEDAHRT
jgi:hypothetical protein